MTGDKKKKIITYFLFCGLGLIFIFLHIWRLRTLPGGVHVDEAGTAYDAWCIAHWGVDRYAKSFPVHFFNYGGGGSSALYVYVTALLFQFFQYDIFIVRITAVIFSFLNFLFGMQIVYKVFHKNVFAAFITGFFITVCPYFILAGRFGLDCNLMLGMSTVFLFCFLQAIDSKKIGYYLLSGITGGFVLYTYTLSHIILPVFLLLSIIYLIRVDKFYLKGCFVMAVPFGILAFPLIYMQIRNLFDLPETKLGIFTITKILGYRSSDIGGFSWRNVKNVLDSIFLGDHLITDSIPGYKNLYVISIFFFIPGFIYTINLLWKSIRSRTIELKVFIVLWFFSVFFMGVLTPTNVYRVNSIFFSYVFFVVCGIKLLGNFIKNTRLKMILYGGVISCYFILFLFFAKYYYFGQYMADNYPIPYFDITIGEAVSYLEDHPEIKNKGTYTQEYGMYFALSVLKSPYELASPDFTMWNYERGNTYFDYYICGGLGPIEEGYNYIVWDIYPDYMEELRALGYEEKKYLMYSLFIWHDE